MMSGKIREALRPARVLLLALVAGVVATFPADHGDARPKKPPVVTPPPPAPPPPPIQPATLNDRLIADAAAYQAYLQRVTAVSPAFVDGAGVAASLRVGSGYEPAALVRGAAAFGALAALREPTFVAAIRAAGPTPQARYVLLNRLIAEPGYVFTFPGADRAALYAKQAIGIQGLRLMAVGQAVKQSAYDVQHSAWSKEMVVDPAGRLAAVKSAGAAAMSPAPDVAATLKSELVGAAPMGLPSGPTVTYETPLIAKAMALAAFAAAGEAGDAAYERLMYLTSERNTAYCLAEAKMNLNQCLAVAKPHYEDIFCLGQHAMIDTGVCLARGGGGLMTISMRVQPLKLKPPARVAEAGRHPARRHR
ncbi:MAG TPA: hypothetical protein VG939_15715 [Caulobacteraceae bacterium]|nr:hypothetical protein [Caulobacteraceae bacterium]